jgi:arylsulfatase A-like enzyme
MKALILEVPALHLGYLGCYGNDWVATPALDRLAAEGVVFDGHFADCLGSYPSARTGMRPLPVPCGTPAPAHGVQAILAAHGIGFAEVGPAGHGAGEAGTALEHTLEAAVSAAERLEGMERWLLWAGLPSLHPPWDVPDAFLRGAFLDEAAEEAEADGETPTPLPDPPVGFVDRGDFALWQRVQLTYAGAVRYLDAGVGLLLDELRGRHLLDELLLVVTAPRGLALGEHGVIGDCRPWLHDELIHLPLVLRLPGGAEAGRRVPALTQPADLLPTLVDAFGLPPAEAQGHSLLPLARGQAERVRPYACAGWGAGGALEWALRAPAWAFLMPLSAAEGDPPRRPQLYVKPDDRWEVNDVRHHHLELVEHMEQVLRDFAAATHELGPLRVPELRDVEAEPAGQGAPAATPAGGGS